MPHGSDPFRWIAVVLSILLGLGVTRLLTALVGLFRARHHAKLDAVPLVWAGCLFLWQLQFWWAIVELPSLVPTWTIFEFLVLVALALLLFVAGALLLPDSLGVDESLRASFERDGRWGLVALSAYFALAIGANAFVWGASPWSWTGALNAALGVLSLVAALTRSRRTQVVCATVYVPLSLVAAWVASQHAY